MTPLRITLLLAVGALAIVAGCGDDTAGPVAESFAGRPLGQVRFDDAFAAAQAVISDHFEIESANPNTGTIKCRPRVVEGTGEQILSRNHEMRQEATFHLLQSPDGTIRAKATILVQRQEQEVERTFNQGVESYSSVPNQSPAQVEAATTPQQNQKWQTIRHASDLENTILTELYKALNPPASQPTSEPIIESVTAPAVEPAPKLTKMPEDEPANAPASEPISEP
jgi:hypothetical protein